MRTAIFLGSVYIGDAIGKPNCGDEWYAKRKQNRCSLCGTGIVRVTPFWVSWYHKIHYSEFELNFPWWITGERGSNEDKIICAAIKAESVKKAKGVILFSYDAFPEKIEWRFCEERPPYWNPFSERFPKADWMIW